MSIYNCLSDFLTDGYKRFRAGTDIYFLGALGAGMLPLSELSRGMGARVFGSDRAYNGGAAPSHITFLPLERCLNIDILVYSLAIDSDDPELMLARERGIMTVSRAELLGVLMLGFSHRIAVAGTHGKSTTVALLHTVLSASGRFPTTLSGAALPHGKALDFGGYDFFVFEACEYRDAFLNMHPTGAVITNIELDHTDYFKSEEQLYNSFLDFAGQCSEHVLIGSSTKMSERLLSDMPSAFSLSMGARRGFGYNIIDTASRLLRFTLSLNGEILSEFELGTLGEHNVANAAAALSMAYLYGADITRAKEALREFQGIPRRQELLGYIGTRAVYYDYAHHPTEVKATLAAISAKHGNATAIFSPHTFTRTRALFSDFVSAFSLAASTVILDVYRARTEKCECNIEDELARAIPHGVHLKSKDAVNYCLHHTSGAIILMGAGDVEEIKLELMEYIN